MGKQKTAEPAPPRFTVDMPEAGEGAVATLSTDDAMALCAEFGNETGLMDVMQGLDSLNLKTIRAAAKHMIKGGSPERAERDMPLEELSGRLMDALLLRIKGKTLAQLQAEPSA